MDGLDSRLLAGISLNRSAILFSTGAAIHWLFDDRLGGISQSLGTNDVNGRRLAKQNQDQVHAKSRAERRIADVRHRHLNWTSKSPPERPLFLSLDYRLRSGVASLTSFSAGAATIAVDQFFRDFDRSLDLANVAAVLPVEDRRKSPSCRIPEKFANWQVRTIRFLWSKDANISLRPSPQSLIKTHSVFRQFNCPNRYPT